MTKNQSTTVKDKKGRKFQLTINNPATHNLEQDTIKEILLSSKSEPTYMCMSDEIGKNGTYHTHIYLVYKNPIRFSTLTKMFNEKAHIEFCKGTSEENRNYVFKTGKWAGTEKGETNLVNTHFEFGTLPVEKQGKRTDIELLIAEVKAGSTNDEILLKYPEYAFKLDGIDKIRATVMAAKFKDIFRDLDVTYIYGGAGVGKTRSIMEKYGYSNVYRVTDYQHPFDSYSCQDVVIFEEFRSSLKIEEMLNYLDGYPVELPARYSNRTACFTKVYLITNIPLEEQYTNIQDKQPATWNALLRRIHHYLFYSSTGIHELDINKLKI